MYLHTKLMSNIVWHRPNEIYELPNQNSIVKRKSQNYCWRASQLHSLVTCVIYTHSLNLRSVTTHNARIWWIIYSASWKGKSNAWTCMLSFLHTTPAYTCFSIQLELLMPLFVCPFSLGGHNPYVPIKISDESNKSNAATKSMSQTDIGEMKLRARVLCSYDAKDSTELNLSANEVIKHKTASIRTMKTNSSCVRISFRFR